MSNPKDLALELALTATIADAASEHKDYLRGQLAETFGEIGADSTRVELDGERIAKVALVTPADKPYIDDEAAFIAYAEANLPDAIVKKVRESVQKAILEKCAPTPDGRAVDKTSGEIVDGVRFRKATPYVSTRFEKEGRALLLAALRSGALTFNPVTTPQLPEGN
jgi:hypothetical protein